MGNIEHGQTANQGGDQVVQQNGLDQGQGDLPEGLTGRAAVHQCRFKQSGVNAQNTGDHDDHGIAVPHPPLQEGDQAAADGYGTEVVRRSAGNTELLQQGIHRSHRIAEQGHEQHTDGGSGDDVGHEDQHLEAALELEAQAGIGEPAGQQQGHADLGNEVAHPHDNGVAQRAPEKAENVGIGIKQLLEVFKADDLVVEDLIPAGSIRHRSVEREQDRVQLEDEEHNKKRALPPNNSVLHNVLFPS